MAKIAWRWVAVTAAVVPVVGAAPVARALEPADIAVVFNTRSTTSLAIARYYLNSRKIPETHLIPLTCDATENITEAQYRTSVVPQLTAALAQRHLVPDEKNGVAGIKCLVTTYDVPLRILARDPSPAERTEIAEYQKQLDSATADLVAQVAAYGQIAPAAASNASAPTTGRGAPPTTAAAKPTWQAVLPQLNTAYTATVRRVGQLSEPARSQAMGQFIALHERVTGMAGIMASLQVQADAPGAEAGKRQLDDLSAKLRELQQQYQDLDKQKDIAKNRQEMITIRAKTDGIVGRVRALAELTAYLQPEATAACFDNELAMLLTDQNYPRTNWIANPRSLENYPQVIRSGGAVAKATLLLIARLDGSSEAKVKTMMETTLKVEAKGLEGKLYLDARGLRGTDAYAAFDADLRRAADWLKQHATIETVLDDRPELLDAKDCPDAALYCGWYSLHNYKESAQWLPGAVGYHVASGEMESLHNPQEKGWVVNLLNRGFSGTLGPTDEPYLNSFPKPSQFFPLLLSGEFTQGEVWEVTSPMLSWRVGFVGDPLYNPFKAKPRVKAEDLKADAAMRNAYAILGK